MLIDVNGYLAAMVPISDQIKNELLGLVLWAVELNERYGGFAFIVIHGIVRST